MVFICDKCVELCNNVIENEDILHLFATVEELGNQSHPAATEQLVSDVDQAKKHAERWRFTLQQIERKLSMRDGEVPAAGDVLASPGFAYLKNKTRDDLLVLAQHHERALRRFEDAQRIAATVLGAKDMASPESV